MVAPVFMKQLSLLLEFRLLKVESNEQTRWIVFTFQIKAAVKHKRDGFM
jgi:hypothetical protein